MSDYNSYNERIAETLISMFNFSYMTKILMKYFLLMKVI